MLIGDPKQAIYAFRGADVYAYLDAARAAPTQATLDVNWRSDQGLIDAYDALFGGARLGHEGIVYRQVTRDPEHQAPRLTGAPDSAPLRIRVVHRDEPSIAHHAGRLRPQRVGARARRRRPRRSTSCGCSTPARWSRASRCEPGHVAVLVQTNRAAALVRDALGDAGIPAVINGAGSVFGTPQAREWLRLLEALERPTSPQRAPRRGADAVPRLERRAGRRRRRRRVGGRPPRACTSGRACCAPAASRRWPRRSRSPRGCPSACSRRSTASAG